MVTPCFAWRLHRSHGGRMRMHCESSSPQDWQLWNVNPPPPQGLTIVKWESCEMCILPLPLDWQLWNVNPPPARRINNCEMRILWNVNPHPPPTQDWPFTIDVSQWRFTIYVHPEYQLWIPHPPRIDGSRFRKSLTFAFDHALPNVKFFNCMIKYIDVKT